MTEYENKCKLRFITQLDAIISGCIEKMTSAELQLMTLIKAENFDKNYINALMFSIRDESMMIRGLEIMKQNTINK